MTALVNFSKTCGGHAQSLRTAANILLTLSDYETTVTVASRLVDLEPFHDNGYYLRAVAHERGGSPHKAIDDYTTAIELFGDKLRIASVSYHGIARSYESSANSATPHRLSRHGCRSILGATTQVRREPSSRHI
jgi:Flp pilus assembly protein TadD